MQSQAFNPVMQRMGQKSRILERTPMYSWRREVITDVSRKVLKNVAKEIATHRPGLSLMVRKTWTAGCIEDTGEIMSYGIPQ